MSQKNLLNKSNFWNNTFSGKVKSSTLIYSVFISLFILLICGALVLLSFFNRVYVESIIKKDKLIYNANSGINLLISNPELVNYNENKSVLLFDSKNDSITISKKNVDYLMFFIVKHFGKKM